MRLIIMNSRGHGRLLMVTLQPTFVRCFYLRGEGDIAAATAAQACLREHGMCSYFGWDPRPPRWRFFYETNLSQREIEGALGVLQDRFGVEVTD
jgi:hypothetical protein